MTSNPNIIISWIVVHCAGNFHTKPDTKHTPLPTMGFQHRKTQLDNYKYNNVQNYPSKF